MTKALMDEGDARQHLGKIFTGLAVAKRLPSGICEVTLLPDGDIVAGQPPPRATGPSFDVAIEKLKKLAPDRLAPTFEEFSDV